MSSSGHTNIHFVRTEIGESSPSEVRIDIERLPYVLGKNADSDMRFDGQHVSRKHATIEIVKGKASLVDQSTVGTWVNGVPLVKNQPFPLMVGDRINLGSEHNVLMVGGEGGTLEGLLMRNPKPELELDIHGRAVLRNGFNIDQPLTATEFDVLSEMYWYRGQVITFERIWAIIAPSEARHDHDGMPEDQVSLDAVDFIKIGRLIAELRKKIERPDGRPVIVLNSTGAGYKMPIFKFLDTPPFTRKLGLI